MVESMGEVAPFIDPDIIFFLNWIFFISSCLVALLILFPTFISLKADGSVNWSWVNVFIPAFILDGLILLVLLMKPSEVDVEEVDDIDLDDDETAASSQNKPKKVSNSLSKWLGVIIFVLLILFQVFLSTKLDGTFDGSWWKVFTPLLVMEFSNLVDMFYSVPSSLKKGYIDFSISESGAREIKTVPFSFFEKISVILDTFGMCALRICQILLICAKLESQIDSSWAKIFIPTWLWGFVKISTILLMAKDSSSTSKRTMIQSSIVAFIFSSLFIYITFGLLVTRLDKNDGTPKASVILIPVFIITGTLFCCLGCCLPCLTLGIRNALAQELKSTDQQFVSVERRIEAGSA